MKNKYGDHAQLLLPDTDTLMYAVEKGDNYADMLSSLELYELSNYPTTHPKYNAELLRNKTKEGS